MNLIPTYFMQGGTADSDKERGIIFKLFRLLEKTGKEEFFYEQIFIYIRICN